MCPFSLRSLSLSCGDGVRGDYRGESAVIGEKRRDGPTVFGTVIDS